MRTILFLTEKEANQYAEENRLETTQRCIEFDERTCDLEYYDEDRFYGVVGTWTGESSAAVYTDDEDETAIAWWYNDGEGPTINIDGEQIEDTELISGVYATNCQPSEIDKDAAQDICIACQLEGVDIYTPEDGEDFEDMAAKLDFGEVLPRRILKAGDYIFCLPKDNPNYD